MSALSKLAERVDGQYRIVSQPPIVVPARDLAVKLGMSPEQIAQQVHELFRAYRATLRDDQRHLLERFEVVDVARKVVGVGSDGTRAFIVLLQGRDQQDPLFLQVKEATASGWRTTSRRAAHSASRSTHESAVRRWLRTPDPETRSLSPHIWQEGPLQPVHRRLLRPLRRSERAGLPSALRGDPNRPPHRARRGVNAATVGPDQRASIRSSWKEARRAADAIGSMATSVDLFTLARSSIRP